MSKLRTHLKYLFVGFYTLLAIFAAVGLLFGTMYISVTFPVVGIILMVMIVLLMMYGLGRGAVKDMEARKAREHLSALDDD